MSNESKLTVSKVGLKDIELLANARVNLTSSDRGVTAIMDFLTAKGLFTKCPTAYDRTAKGLAFYEAIHGLIFDIINDELDQST
jgi:hypothetical protein